MNKFHGRTIQLVRDLSTDEQIYLYEQTRRLKDELSQGGRGEDFRIKDPDLAAYLFFMEDSTRTKESFRNAAKFHGITVNDFDAKSSSFQKKESITDTVKMLLGYNPASLFIIRSRIEGVCRWLETAMGQYAETMGFPKPSFINAGDGRHEHPTQEFLDEFSFLEHLSWDRSQIHIALVGDLFHGRTIHSKVDGLGIFSEVRVDLIAPPDIMMPGYYINAMKERGFEVRIFESIQEYLDQHQVASIWYFTRLQLERMGERLQNRAGELRKAVTFQHDWMNRLPPGTRFFHPLPRHSETPTIPSFLDTTPLNGWDAQSRNGYLTRIIEIGLLGGTLGADFSGTSIVPQSFDGSFIFEAQVVHRKKREYKIGIRPVENGMVIDHIGKGKSPQVIWEHISTIRRLLNLNVVSSHGVYRSEGEGVFKGIISLPGQRDFEQQAMETLGAAAPGCTLNRIQGAQVVQKLRIGLPPRVQGLTGTRCKNEDCVSSPELHEPILPDFYRSGENLLICRFCETPHSFNEIWGSSWAGEQF